MADPIEKDELAAQLVDLRRLHDMSARLSTTTTLELDPIFKDTLSTAAAIEGTDLGLLLLYDADLDSLSLGASLGFDETFLKTIADISSRDSPWRTALSERRRVVVDDVEANPEYARWREAASGGSFAEVHHTPLVARSGKAIGVLSTCFRTKHTPSDREAHLITLCARQGGDYIENARLYVKVREADSRKDEFLAVLAHELRNPLAPISNALHLMRLSGELSPTNERMHEIIERQVGNLVRLVDDLLEASRITRGKIALRQEQVDLAAIVRNALETVRPTIEASGHQLAVSFSAEPMILDADPVRLAQVLSNLLSNAAKYTPAGGQIWITARTQGDEAIVSVRDNGMGIAPEMLPRVFNMFAQGELTRASGGLGIGLALAQSLVRMHGGQITAHSEGLGKGSEFVLHLPLVSKDLRRGVTAPALQSNLLSLPRRKILVVDDARAAVFTLAKLLEMIGQEVFSAHDAATALEIARIQHPDIVISDIGMPVMSGYELAQRLRSEAGLENAVLVALTGYGQESDRRRAIDAGFDRHLVKPVSLDMLRELIATAHHVPASAHTN